MTETVLGGVIDHHVHLGLVERDLLADSPVVEVHDLGWDPVAAQGFRANPPSGVDVHIVGPFHTAPGGYPTGRKWAPPSSVREIADAADAGVAVREAVTRMASGIKVTLHDDFANLSEEVLEVLVEEAHVDGLPVLVHAEGRGMVELALRVGADVLVHAPWTEPVPEGVLAASTQMTWISTLAIHAPSDQQVAIDNIVRFRALGGTVRYGTDMGNGPTPVGVNAEEIRALGRAGLHGEELIDAVTGGPPALSAPLPRPTNADELIRWLGAARRLPATIQEDE
ncbi:hypothetical protein BJ980_003329 [Nocardioides daedukensis]|uniref:Hydrolase n=1 Tax=Nocardioides daedukensis TaxID=634462 RepID=A0A7Y9S321_9ACTN|nr:hydrolase [Nocardioides daedukensis]NYG60406.1 hypothetical protein [Nocardioides daedukensis]